jgi:redox-sensitive bicupin YhaK (pirin superfamily)
MITIRRAGERGRSQLDWLHSRHTFSFSNYYDPDNMGYSVLRVINEDRIAPAAGFGSHSHRDMEIISYVLDGGLEHKDSLGNGSVIRPGEVQRMSAGTGITHSEYNASKLEPAHFLQIWILPAVTGIAPSYEQRRFDDSNDSGRWRLLVSPDGREGSLTLNQNALMYMARLKRGEARHHALAADRQTLLHVARGEAVLSGHRIVAGDSAMINDEQAINLSTDESTEVLMFDLP